MNWFTRQTDRDALEAMLMRAGIACSRGGDATGSLIGIGDDGAFHSASTEGDFVQFDFTPDGRLRKVGIWKNWVSEPEVSPKKGQ